MRVREEAKRQGAVLSYHRISEVTLETPGSKTERLPSSTPGVIPIRRDGLYDTVDTRVFLEQPAEADAAQFKLLAKQ